MTTHEGELLDFWLSIDARGDGTYEVVVRSPAGDGRSTVRLGSVITDAEQVAESLNADWRGLRRSGEAPGGEVRQDFEKRLRETGRRLFDGIMVESVGQRYRSSYDKATDRQKGLRVRLRIQAPELAALPWEYLFDSVHDHFIARTPFTSVVRYVEVDRKVELLRVDFPLSVLGVLSGPSDQAPLAKEVERQMIERALADLVAAGRIRLHWATDGTFSEFAQALRRHDPHIVHFIGHGAYDAERDSGIVLFEDEHGASMEIDADTLGAQLLGHPTVRLMVLNSCEGARSSGRNLFSSTAGTLVRRGVPAVIAMQYAITDKAALLFSEELYRGLADVDPVDRAVSSARLQMHAADPDSPEWGTPVLFLQSETGTLFEVPGTTAIATPAGITPAGTALVVVPAVHPLPSVPVWRRLTKGALGVVKSTRTIVVSASAVLLFLVNGYFKARDERARATASLDATFDAIRKDTSASGRMAAFNDLRGRQLPGQLEPYAIRKVVDLIRIEQGATGTCSTSPNSRAQQLSAAFDAVRNFQGQVDRPRQFSERAMGALINLLAENPARPLSRVVLEGVDLRGTDLTHLSLDSASFRRSCLLGARFDSASLHAATFDSARLDAASFVGVRGRGMSLHNAALRGTDFSGAELTGADLFGARAPCAIFIGTTLDSSRFEHTEAPWTSFEGASLVGVRRWEEAADVSSAMFTNPRTAADDPIIVSALRRGAASLDVDRREWIDGRERALRANGVCAPPRR